MVRGTISILRWFLLGCIAAALLSGCGQKRAVRYDDRRQFPAGHVKKTGDVEPYLRVEASRWHGTPHRMGGNDLNGVDCSGLVRRIYKDHCLKIPVFQDRFERFILRSFSFAGGH
jgi:hypothetical protein